MESGPLEVFSSSLGVEAGYQSCELDVRYIETYSDGRDIHH